LPDITQTNPANLNLNSYSTIIFDLGVVIIDLHLDKCVHSFSEMTGVAPQEIEKWLPMEYPFHAYETGQISTETFIEAIGQLANKPLTMNQVDMAWNAMLGDIPLARLQLIERIAAKHRTFVLSNTNELHIQEFHKSVERSHGLAYFRSLFQKVYYSYEMGARKPESKIYQTVLEEQGLHPSEVLFIDDNEQNIRGAEALGLGTFLAPTADSWMNHFYEQGY
jgi:glucose-1-phosphatase